MVANPLNSAFCVGSGLGVDILGRPTWKRELAGIWSAPDIYMYPLSNTGFIVVSNLVAHIQNVSDHARELIVRAQSYGFGFANFDQISTMSEHRYSVGPTVTEGVSLASSTWCGNGLAVGFPTAFGGPTFVTVPAGGAMNVAFTALCRALSNGQYLAHSLGMTIEAHWLGA